VNNPKGVVVDPETAAQRAHVLLESEIQTRLSAVRELAQRLNALENAAAEYDSAWQIATEAGWSETTLRDIGLRAPEALPVSNGRRSAAETGEASSVAPVVQLPAPAAHTGY
jgi:hypothetical protein